MTIFFKNSAAKVALLTLLTLLFTSHSAFAAVADDLKDPLSTTNPNNCTGCHQNQVSDWQKSDHAKAMALPNKKSVLGNFNNNKVEHFSQSARFYQQDNKFWVSLTHEGKTNSYPVAYTFGHYPLQQYLVKADNGKYQVFPFNWDSRPASEGGQKWYPVYADEDIKAADRLHWQQPLQTWNGMCADCHSDGLKRQYSVKKDTFKTVYDNINVGCQSCHGKMDEHSKNPNTSKVNNTAKYDNKWLIKAGTATASWQGEKRDNSFMDNCFSCHALRSPLTDGITPNTPFLDQFSPSFLQPNLYHADGQIKEEVYVYGSFLQSKMFAAGVNCLDCHDKHTMKIKVQNNGLCLQCHNAEVFEQKSHHQHEQASTGSQCVNCHMPENRYMGVDDRRDHSFKIPRPHLSDEFKTPNACVQCHDDKDNQWASKNVAKWHGKPKTLSASEQTRLNIQQGTPVTIEAHLALINDTAMNAIYRATAIVLLPNSTANIPAHIAKPWTNSSEPLIRLAIARTGNLLSEADRKVLFSSLLTDTYKAIRVAAANQLLSIPGMDQKQLEQAFAELVDSNDISSWRGEGNLNQSMVHFSKGDIANAIESLKAAINVDPYFEASYVNLADIYRNLGETAKEKALFKQAIIATPKSALLHYSYGLHQIRNQEKAASVQSFSTALRLQPDNSQYAYIYLLALDNTGKTKQALATLKMQINRYKNNSQMLQLGLSFAQKLQDRNAYQSFSQYLQQLQ
ncbi:MAG: multiheme c-type cytochrome [Thalassotalea sp.]